MVKRKDPRKGKMIVYALTVAFALLYIFLGRHLAMQGYPDWEKPEAKGYKAEVTEIVSNQPSDRGRELFFKARVLSGPDKGQEIVIRQAIFENIYPVQEAVAVGDRVLFAADTYQEDSDWQMLDYLRSDAMIWLALAFAAVVIVFGRFKGLNTLISMTFTCLAIFLVFIPSILSGHNIYLWSISTCIYIIAMSMLFINGANRKSFTAGLGCATGLAISGLIAAVMDKILNLTGMTSEDTLYLQMIEVAKPIDLTGVIFASVIIGALGAIMDVSMDIASSLNELRETSPQISGRQLAMSGFNIGRDIMGTMANTLVLAYIGGGLITTLLLAAYNISMFELFNMELIVVEILQALVGSFGIMLAIPFTSLLCGIVYPRKV